VTSVSRPLVPIPFFNYRGAFAALEPELLSVVQNVLRRGAFIQQSDLVEFEESLAGYLDVKYAFGVGNATDGLIMAMRASGVGPGDEVIFPSHTMVATAAAAVHVGALPIPVDCRDDHLIDPSSIESALTSRTRAIVPVHLNGRTCAMDAIQRIANDNNLIIVEDAAQALGAKFKGQAAGTFGAAGVFSFYPAKILGCLGDGGAVVTNDERIAEQIRLLRDHGRNSFGDVEVWGFNSRLDNIQAAVLNLQFKDYQTIIDRRRAIASQYDVLLEGVSQVHRPPPPETKAENYDVFQNYEIEAEGRDALRDFLAGNGVGTIIQWGGKAVHQFAKLRFDVRLPRTELLFRRALLLPLNMVITDDEVRSIGFLIRSFYGN
jgi:dTDP-4-amino-4,6-dideoxygalactose transaminase